MQMQSFRSLTDQNSLPRQSNSWGSGSAGIGDEYALPDGCALGCFYILDVKHKAGKTFVEDSRLHFEGDLRRLHAVLQSDHGSLRLRRDIDSVGQCEKPGRDRKDGNYAEEAPNADAAGAHCGDLAVGRQSAEADQNADQHPRRNADGESYG